MSVTVAQLRSFASSFGFAGVNKMTKVELLKLLKFPQDEVETMSPKKKVNKPKSTRSANVSITVADLREFARSFGFTDVAKMKKAELEELLCIPKEKPSLIAHLSVADLREYASSFGFYNISKLTRKELIELLRIPEVEEEKKVVKKVTKKVVTKKVAKK